MLHPKDADHPHVERRRRSPAAVGFWPLMDDALRTCAQCGCTTSVSRRREPHLRALNDVIGSTRAGSTSFLRSPRRTSL
jgi:hypothetical protein